MPSVHGIVAAAGEGRRFGGGTPKQLLVVAGRPVLEWSVEAVLRVADSIVVAVPRSYLSGLESQFSDLDMVTCVAGGSTRFESVRFALARLDCREGDLVAIHDGARPAVDQADLAAVVAAAELSGAAVLGRPATDTIKRVHDGVVVETMRRSELFHAETPQVFEYGLLARAVELAEREGLDPTDEASIAERVGGASVVAVEARHPNPKITAPSDVERVEALLAAGSGGRLP